MNPMIDSGNNRISMRIIEELDTGDTVVTYYDVIILNDKYYYVYDDVNHGPFDKFDDAVEAAVSDLIPESVLE